jgi:hypothetical protein
MEKLMKYLQYILLGLVVFVHPIMPSLVLIGLSLISFQKHDWQEGFFDDRWGLLGSASLLAGVAVYMITIYLPSQA